MQAIVADTTPLNYLVLIQAADILPNLYRHIFHRLTAWTPLILGAIRVQPVSLELPQWLSRAFARAKQPRPTCLGPSASCPTPLANEIALYSSKKAR